MGSCNHCGQSAVTISDTLGFCAACIRNHFATVWPAIKAVHDRSRRAFGLPLDPPDADGGLGCGLCVHGCRIPEGRTGFCGLRQNSDSHIRGGRPHEGNLYYYFDPLPTNCVGDFVCPAGTGCGYPAYSVSHGPEIGYRNLAVFYHACGFNCLYCQNFAFKQRTFSRTRITARQLAEAVDDQTTCICYFGGDPTPQVLHAVKAARLARRAAAGRILRICWETNGSAREPYLSLMAELALTSGGLVKFDLKAWHSSIHLALCGVTNAQTLANFKTLAAWTARRPQPPFLIASTLLVPGYVDEPEVAAIAGFIAGLDPKIPYRLLAFYPHFYLNDLPTTSRSHLLRCREAAFNAGLNRVSTGNLHLLSEDYD